MYCPNCGAQLTEFSKFCSTCGKRAASDLAMASSGLPGQAQETSGQAIGSLISGVFGLLFFPASLVAIILGHISRSTIRKSNGRVGGSGMALAGLILGYVGITILPLLIVAAIAIPNLLRARMAANESSAVASIRTLANAERAYMIQFPSVGYTCRLASLGGSASASPTTTQAGLIDARLSSGTKNGYRFELRNCTNAEDGAHFQVLAYPVLSNNTGKRAFCSDESEVIRFNVSGSPDDCLSSGTPLE